MDENQKYEARYKQMIETPIAKLIPTLALPTIISMLISSIYNMADTYFVSQLGRSASGAVSIIFSLMALVQTIGFTFGVGSGNYISRSLGRKDREIAEKTFSTGFFTTIILGVCISTLGLLNLEPLVYFLGATETIAPYAMDYARYILIATPFMMASFVMNNVLRAQGNAFYAMIGLSTGGVLNLILDPLFIFGIGPFPEMGISGAAIATGLSQFVSFCILLCQCNFRGNTIKIEFKKFYPKKEIYSQILKAGAPTFGRQGLASVSSILLNTVANPYGDVVIASAGIVNRIMMFIYSALMGYGQGFQPVAGFNYGAKRYDRVLEAFWFSVKVAVVLLSCLGILTFFSADIIIEFFRAGDTEVIEFASFMLMVNCSTLPLQAWVIMTNQLSQSIGYSFRATIIAISKQGICYIPLLLILPNILGARGIQLVSPITDVGTAIIASVITITILKDLNKLRDEMPKQGDEKSSPKEA